MDWITLGVRCCNEKTPYVKQGKVLTDGETYSPVVYLGKNENPDNWQEVNESEAPEK